MTRMLEKVVAATAHSGLEWPLFSEGQQLRDSDLTLGVTYTRDLSRLLFRSFFGCGVVCGLRVSLAAGECGKLIVSIEPGLALDCLGDPVHVASRATVSLNAICAADTETKAYVVLRRRSQSCKPRESAGCCGGEAHRADTRVSDAYEINVVETLKAGACGCITAKDGEAKASGAAAPAAVKDEAAAIAGKAEAKAEATEHEAVAKSGKDPAAPALAAAPAPEPGCLCADPALPCLKAHYDGDCSCCGCCSEWIILAALIRNTGEADPSKQWSVSHGVRRFIRPVLMRDPEARAPDAKT